MLPPTIPIFPLPNAVLFPGVFLPLHIFEPRYRAMVADALRGDRVIGMALLRPGWESDYEGRPPIFAIGCAGLVTHAERLPDGRFDIVLKGLSRFRVVEEEPGRPYRVARVEGLAEAAVDRDREALATGRRRLEALLAPILPSRECRFPATLGDDEVVNGLSQCLDLEPIERQALLECAGALARCRLLVQMLEMKMVAPRPAGGRH
jgi:Lon protease-like protein